jgi:hypothetical protein
MVQNTVAPPYSNAAENATVSLNALGAKLQQGR